VMEPGAVTTLVPPRKREPFRDLIEQQVDKELVPLLRK